jgi:hypothetical protein
MKGNCMNLQEVATHQTTDYEVAIYDKWIAGIKQMVERETAEEMKQRLRQEMRKDFYCAVITTWFRKV